MNLTPHFTLRELTRSEYAERKGLSNEPPPDVVAALTAWCEHIGEPIRVTLGKPINVNSGYRAPAVNKAIGGSETSQHCKGQAVDFEINGFSNRALAQAVIDLKLPFDQLILELHDDANPNSGWVHVSYRADGHNRGEVLRMRLVSGKTTYSQGLD